MTEKFLSPLLLMFISLFKMHVEIKKKFDIVIKDVTGDIQEKRTWRKKWLLTKTCKCYKVSTFH